MSVITRENSEDSIDRLEAEVNEVIRPGTAKRKASQDRFPSRRNSLTPRPRPAPLQTSFDGPTLMSPSTTTTISAGSSHKGLRYAAPNSPVSSSPQRQRRLSNGHIRSNSFGQGPRTPASTYTGIGSAYTDTIIRSPPPSLPQAPPLSHQHSYSENSIYTQTPGSAFSPPSFHLPTRMQHQSIMSNQSVMSTATSHHSRGTFGGRRSESTGLSPPPRLTQTTTGGFVPKNTNYTNNANNNNHHPGASPLGSPVSFATKLPNRSFTSGGSSPASPTSASPVSGIRFPFSRPGAVSSPDPALTNSNAATSSPTNTTSSSRQHRKKHGREQRASGFSADGSSSASTREILEEGDEALLWTQQPHEESPSPLRSHPPLSPKGNWV